MIYYDLRTCPDVFYRGLSRPLRFALRGEMRVPMFSIGVFYRGLLSGRVPMFFIGVFNRGFLSEVEKDARLAKNLIELTLQ